MKKTLLNSLIILVVLGSIFFLVKTFGGSILSELMGSTKSQQEDITLLKNEKLLNKKVPFFDLLSIDNNRIKLSSFTDKPFVVIFWASHNIESANQLKILDEYISLLNKEDNLVPVIFINSLEEESSVKSFIKRGGYGVSVALDPKGSISMDFNIKSLPTSFFIDRDGIVREIYAGVLNKTMFVDKIEQLLK